MADTTMESVATLTREMAEETERMQTFQAYQECAKRFLDQPPLLAPNSASSPSDDFLKSINDIPVHTLVMEHETQPTADEVWNAYQLLDSATKTLYKVDYYNLMNRNAAASAPPSVTTREEPAQVDEYGYNFGATGPTVVFRTQDDDDDDSLHDFRKKKLDFSEPDPQSEAMEQERLEAYMLARIEAQLRQDKRDKLFTKKFILKIQSEILQQRKNDLTEAEEFIQSAATKVKEAQDLVSFIPKLSEQLLRSQAEETHILWEKDTPDCQLCHTPYSFFFRAHHCRRCGQCVCNSCSFYVGAPPMTQNESVLKPTRICRTCHEICSVAQRQFPTADEAKFARLPANDSLSATSSLETLSDGKPRFFVFPADDMTRVTSELSNWSKIPWLAHSLMEGSHYALQQTGIAATNLATAAFQQVVQFVRPPPAIENTKK